VFPRNSVAIVNFAERRSIEIVKLLAKLRESEQLLLPSRTRRKGHWAREAQFRSWFRSSWTTRFP